MRLNAEDAIIYILSQWKRRDQRVKRQTINRQKHIYEMREKKELDRLQIIEQDRIKDLTYHMNLLKEI